MRYWKTVPVQNYELIAKKVLWLGMQQLNLAECKFWNPLDLELLARAVPELIDGVKHLGRIKEAALLVLRTDSCTLHVDHTSGLNQGVQARLNMPILNTEGSVTAFYYFPPEVFAMSKVEPGTGTRVWVYGEHRKKFTPVTQVAVTQPTILRISAPHTVFCDTNKYPRITLTMSFHDDLVTLLDQDA